MRRLPMHEVHYCIAAENKASGFYSNHHLGGVCFTHNTAYHNGGANYRLVNRKDRETAVDVPGYGHVLKQNLSSLLMLPRQVNGMLNEETLRFMRLKQGSIYGCSWDKMEEVIMKL